MKPTQNEILKIRHDFAKMQSKSDFLSLLNYAKKIRFGESYVPFEERQLNRYINQQSSPKTVWEVLNTEKFRRRQQNYTYFEIPKKSGGIRSIHSPKKGLKTFQTILNLIFQCVYEPHNNATGFIPGKSILSNAKKHVGKKYVYNIDLKDFFPSITQARIWGRLLVKPFCLGSSDERRKIAGMIAIICCMEKNVVSKDANLNKTISDGVSILPQGAPTSPTLTNAICEKLDFLLTGLAKRFGLTYSRYADDITFSSNHNNFPDSQGRSEPIFGNETTFQKELKRIIKDQSFVINESKVRLQGRGFRQEVTGIVVNEKMNVKNSYVKEIRSWLYKWETYGYSKCKTWYNINSINENNNSNNKKIVPELSLVLNGKLLYLKMVKGKHDDTYVKLQKRFDKLMLKLNKEKVLLKYSKQLMSPQKLTTQEIIDLILEKGVNEAMKFYIKS